jgi:hypothetical protein
MKNRVIGSSLRIITPKKWRALLVLMQPHLPTLATPAMFVLDSYYPQSTTLGAVTTAVGGRAVPQWPDRFTSPDPLKTWICVPPFKQTAVDQKKSMVVDVMYKGLGQISHRSGNTGGGVDAAFGDGHVLWQGVKQEPDAFDPAVWAAIAAGSTSGGQNLRYALSLFRP